METANDRGKCYISSLKCIPVMWGRWGEACVPNKKKITIHRVVEVKNRNRLVKNCSIKMLNVECFVNSGQGCGSHGRYQTTTNIHAPPLKTEKTSGKFLPSLFLIVFVLFPKERGK